MRIQIQCAQPYIAHTFLGEANAGASKRNYDTLYSERKLKRSRRNSGRQKPWKMTEWWFSPGFIFCVLGSNSLQIGQSSQEQETKTWCIFDPYNIIKLPTKTWSQPFQNPSPRWCWAPSPSCSPSMSRTTSSRTSSPGPSPTCPGSSGSSWPRTRSRNWTLWVCQVDNVIRPPTDQL